MSTSVNQVVGIVLVLCFVVLLDITNGQNKESADALSITPIIEATVQAVTPTPNAGPDAIVLPHFVELMELNKACASPCWWGFQVGVSKVSDLLDFLHENGLDRGWEVESRLERPGSTGDGSGLVYLYLDTASQVSFTLEFIAKQGILTEMEIELYNPARWLPSTADTVSFAQIVSRYSQYPDIFQSPKSRYSSFSILLVYPKQRMDILYVFDLSEKQTNDKWSPFRVCPVYQSTTEIIVHLTDAGGMKLLEEQLAAAPASDKWNNSFDVSQSELIDFFRKHPDQCLETYLLAAQKDVTPTPLQ